MTDQTLREQLDWLREVAEERMKQAISREDTAQIMRGATKAELRSSKLLAEKMAGRKLPSTSVDQAKASADIEDTIATKLKKEAMRITGWADELENILASKSASDTPLREQLAGLRERWRRGIFAQDRDGDMRKSQAKRCADELETVLAAYPAGVEPGAEPWLYAITEPSGAWHDGENCVFGDRESAKDEVDLLNDSLESGEEGFKLVPLYRAAAPQPVQLDGEQLDGERLATKLYRSLEQSTDICATLAQPTSRRAEEEK